MQFRRLSWGYKMKYSVVLATWTNKDHPLGISRQIAIPYEIDPRVLTDADIWDLCYKKGFNIYGDLTWEILINNSTSSHYTEQQLRASRLYEKLADKVIDDSEAMGDLNELYEIAYNNAYDF